MKTISIISEHVANQIAAGEVIERPMNIVKELLENSLDANATKISVHFKNGGKSFVRVEDNGKGMSPEDAVLCFQRYATSKLRAFEDLQQVQSFGFRGEALPSIASVAKVSLQTRTTEEELGTEIEILGGEIKSKRPCVCNVGSTFQVEQLFYNVPARRKFLKSDNTESANIIQLVRLYAVAHPGIYFELKENDKTIFISPPCRSIFTRIKEIWPRRSQQEWVSFKKDFATVQLEGVLSPPGLTDAISPEIRIFVNRRPIASAFLASVIKESYRGFLPSGVSPSVFLLIHVDPINVDVNVHPTKKEVRFKNEFQIRDFVLEAIRTFLSQMAATTLKTALPEIAVEDSTSLGVENIKLRELRSDLLKHPSHNLESQVVLGQTKEIAVVTPVESTSPIKAWRFLTLWKNDYVLLDAPNVLIVLNCKAVSRRIVYEEVKQRISQNDIPSQELLMPYSFELEPTKAEKLAASLDFLNTNCGFKLHRFGRNAFLLESLPIWVKPGQEPIFLDNLLNLIELRGVLDVCDWTYESIAKLFASQASLAVENEAACARLLDDLLKCQNITTSPEGLPLWWELPLSEVNKRLK